MPGADAAPMTEPEFFTIAEVADWLRVSYDTVRRMIERGDLAVVRAGPRTSRIPIAEVKRLESMKATPDARGRR
jgi:excisionase family DNA binding protein